ncbi:MAG: trypsin-like peptidase domain-containing protein [bacterium]
MFNRKFVSSLILILSVSISFGFFIYFFSQNEKQVVADNLEFNEQEATIRAIKKVSPAVVNIVVSETRDVVSVDLNTGESEIKKENSVIGNGTGFIFSSDGYIMTNKHVIETASNKKAEYKVVLNNNKEYLAQFVSKDFMSDLAVLKIFEKDLPFVELGDSDKLEIGSTVVAIGNVLGKYQNSATKGIVSGLKRDLNIYGGAGKSENLEDVIQTDAEINYGNSGGPLVNLNGQVVGINVAIDSAGTSVGFAIPVNDIKSAIRTVIEYGRIIRPMLGVRYIMLTPDLAAENNLSRQDGAWIVPQTEDLLSIVAGSPAEAAGFLPGDIIFEINGIKLNEDTTLSSVIQKYRAGARIGLKVQRGSKIFIRIVVLQEMK